MQRLTTDAELICARRERISGLYHVALLICLSVSLSISLCSCTREVEHRRAGVLTLSLEQHSAWVRLFNPFSPNARRFTRAGICEPLLIKNSVTGEYAPWLATGYQWSDTYTELTLAIRSGVRFSDGVPLTAQDVVYSFEQLQRHPALDTQGLWTVLKRVHVSAPMQVSFELNAPNKPKLDDIAHHPIVPQHIWREVKDPVTFTNPTPIATGPFTEATTFRAQLYELGRNPPIESGAT